MAIAAAAASAAAVAVAQSIRAGSSRRSGRRRRRKVHAYATFFFSLLATVLKVAVTAIVVFDFFIFIPRGASGFAQSVEIRSVVGRVDRGSHHLERNIIGKL
jgi:hypothetical protein